MNCPKCNQPVAGLSSDEWTNEKATIRYHHVAAAMEPCKVRVDLSEADERIRRERALIAEGA